jgi:hypothetical protein
MVAKMEEYIRKSLSRRRVSLTKIPYKDAQNLCL